MAIFPRRNLYTGTGRRLTGSRRYFELLERDLTRFLLVNLFTIIGFLPFAVGVLISILSSSILILIPSCIIGGAIAGPALSCMYDAIFRSLRDVKGKFTDNYKRAWKQNWKQAVIPGVIFCLLIGFYTFMLMMFWWSLRFPGLGTLIIYILGLLLITMFFTVYWPILVLFDQTGIQRFRNCILFTISFFKKVFGCAVLQILYWAIMVLFLPWSVLTMFLIGFWFILFSSCFLLYNTMDEIFHIEEQIAEVFPEQAVFYEDDETWLRRKQEEQIEERRKEQKTDDGSKSHR